MCHVSMQSSKFYNYRGIDIPSHSDPKKFKGLILSETIDAISFRRPVFRFDPTRDIQLVEIHTFRNSIKAAVYTKQIFSAKENFETIKSADLVNFTYCDWLLCNNIFLAAKK